MDTKKIILVVEDDENLSNALVKTVSENGYIAVSARTMASCTELLKKEKPDLILLDIELPDGNGLDVLTNLRDNEETASVPVIAITNHDEEEYMSELMEKGVFKVLVKSDQSLKKVVEVIKETLR